MVDDRRAAAPAKELPESDHGERVEPTVRLELGLNFLPAFSRGAGRNGLGVICRP